MTKLKYILIALCFGVVKFGFSQEQLSLPKALEIGLKQNFDIQLSLQTSSIASLNNTWEAAGRYPNIGIVGTSNYSNNLIKDNSPATLNSNLRLNTSWLLFGGMQVNINKSILNLQYNLAKGTESIQVENTIKEIILSYYSIVIEKRLYGVYSDLVKLSKDRYEREKMAYDMGGTDTYNLIQAESAYLTDQKQLIKQEQNLKALVYRINLVMNVELDTQWQIEDSIDLPSESYIFEDMQDKMLANNKNIKNQYINQQISEQNISLSKSALYPTIALNAEMGYGNTHINSALSSPSQSINSLNGGVGISLNYDIYKSGKIKRGIAISKINNEIESTKTEKMVQTLTNALMTTLDSYNFTKRLVEIGNRDIEVAKVNMDLSYEKYSNGSISSFDFRQTQVAYAQSIYSQSQMVYQLINSNTNLIQLIGGLVQ